MQAFRWSEHLVDLVLLLLLATLWGTSYTFIKVAGATIPPATLLATRTLVGGFLLLAFMRARGETLPREGSLWKRFLIQAGLNVIVPFALVAWAEHTVDAGLATALNSTSPIFTFILSVLLAGYRQVTMLKLAGVFAGLIGICVIAGVEPLIGFAHLDAAQLALLAASVCYAGADIYGRSFPDLGPITAATGSLLASACILVPASLILDKPWTLTPSLSSILSLLGLAVLSTALGFVVYFQLIRRLGPVGVAAQAYLRVPIGVAIGILCLGETMTMTAWLGMGCVVCSVVAMTIPAGARRGVYPSLGIAGRVGKSMTGSIPSTP